MTLSADERAAITEGHGEALGQSYRSRKGYCAGCGGKWPCDTEKMRAALVAAEADVAKLGDGLVQWMEAAKAEEARAKALAELLEGVLIGRSCWRGDESITPVACDTHYSEWLYDVGECYYVQNCRAALAAYREAAP